MGKSVTYLNFFWTDFRQHKCKGSILSRAMVSTRQKIEGGLCATNTTWYSSMGWCRATSTPTPGAACGAPHVELLSSGVEPCVELCLCITGLCRNVFLWFQCVQYGLDILTFRAEINLDIQSRAFDRRVQPRVTQSWDTHVICRCKIVLVPYNKVHRYCPFTAHQTALCMWWCLGDFKLLGTTGKLRSKHIFFCRTPSPMLPLNC